MRCLSILPPWTSASMGPSSLWKMVPGTFTSDATQVHKITFVITPDTAHNSTQFSYSLRFFDAQGTTLLRAFFLAMYDAQAHLRPERVQQYEALRAYGDG